MKKKYKTKITPKLIRKLKLWWGVYKLVEMKYWEQIIDLEDRASKDTGIEDIEIFFCDNEAVGIGNSSRTMPLVPRERFE